MRLHQQLFHFLPAYLMWRFGLELANPVLWTRSHLNSWLHIILLHILSKTYDSQTISFILILLYLWFLSKTSISLHWFLFLLFFTGGIRSFFLILFFYYIFLSRFFVNTDRFGPIVQLVFNWLQCNFFVRFKWLFFMLFL